MSQIVTPTEREILTAAAGLEEFNNALLTELTNKQKQHISKYIEKFVRLGLVRRIRQEGNEVFYEVAADVRPLVAVRVERDKR